MRTVRADTRVSAKGGQEVLQEWNRSSPVACEEAHGEVGCPSEAHGSRGRGDLCAAAHGGAHGGAEVSGLKDTGAGCEPELQPLERSTCRSM